VSTTNITIAHFSFLNALAALESDETPEWCQIAAGFLCLRLIDVWAAPLPVPVRISREQIAAVRAAINTVNVADPMRGLLTSVLRAIETSRPGGPSAVLRPRLMAYGRALEHQARWELALDVYQTVLRLCDPRDEWDDAASAALRLAECHRQRAEWDDAERAFGAAARHAAMGGDIATVLRARCLSAAVTAERGNLPAAEAALIEAEQDAEAADLPELRGLARHGRAHVAFQRRDYEDAVLYAFAALADLKDLAARDRALADVAQAFAELGVRRAARDAQLIIAATAQESYVRWSALINLMELAALDGIEPIFEQYRRELAEVPLPPRLAGYYHFYAGAGAWTFGRRDTARAEYRQALEIATANRLAQLSFDVEGALQALELASLPASVQQAAEPTPATARIADALERMRTQILTTGS
jgi:tetratricopeptide (TPR) repeat protein